MLKEYLFATTFPSALFPLFEAVAAVIFQASSTIFEAVQVAELPVYEKAPLRVADQRVEPSLSLYVMVFLPVAVSVDFLFMFVFFH